MGKLKGAAVARLALLLIGAALLAWAVILPASECVYPSADYGVCSDNSALKWELAIVSVILFTVALISYMIARRRGASAAAWIRPSTSANTDHRGHLSSRYEGVASSRVEGACFTHAGFARPIRAA
jgi:hypothetical protein